MGAKRLRAIATFATHYIIATIVGTLLCLIFPVLQNGNFLPDAPEIPTRLASCKDDSDRTTFTLKSNSIIGDLSIITSGNPVSGVSVNEIPLHFISADGLASPISIAQIDPSDYVCKDNYWELRLTVPSGSLNELSVCSKYAAAGVVAIYNYLLPFTQGLYITIAAYGLLLYFSKQEQSLLMFSLYSLSLFIWGLLSLASHVLQIDSFFLRMLDSVIFWSAVAYSTTTSISFCKLPTCSKYFNKWYLPLVAGTILGILLFDIPSFYDNLLVIMIYMIGGTVILLKLDEKQRLPRAVLYGLSISQGLRTVFLLYSPLGITLPLFLELIRKMHLLAMPYVIGCLIDIGGTFSRNFKQAELQATELAHVNKELDKRVEIRTQEVLRQQELRTSILANLFHDCKTPLSIIRGSIDCIIDEKSFNEKHVSIIKHQITYLTDIIDELFAVVKLQDNALLMETEPVSLAPLLKTIALSCSVEASARNIKVTCSCSTHPVAWGDEMWLNRAFQNLVANAVNFSKTGGSVEIKVGSNNAMAIVRITDHGAGIDPSEIDRVFDRYYRTAKKRTSHQSTGLGLSIAKGVIEKHNGSINIESKLGSGTTFTVYLPLWAEDDGQS